MSEPAESVSTKMAVEASSVWAGQLGRFFNHIFGPGAEAMGELIGDRVRLWRAMNLFAIADRLENEIVKRRLDPSSLRHLNLPDAVLLIEAASFESDERVQDLWAKLLASALDAERDISIAKGFVETVKALDAVDALVLQHIAKIHFKGPRNYPSTFSIGRLLSLELGMSEEAAQTRAQESIVNLYRLNCVEPELYLSFALWGDSERDADHVSRAEFRELASWVYHVLADSDGEVSTASPHHRHGSVNWRITGFAERLMRAIEPVTD